MSATALPEVPQCFAVDISLTIVGELTPLGHYDLTISMQSARLAGQPTPFVAYLRTVAFHPKFAPINLVFDGRLPALNPCRG